MRIAAEINIVIPRLQLFNRVFLRLVKAANSDLLTIVPPLNGRSKMLQLHGLRLGEVLISFRHIQAVEPSFRRGMRSIEEQNICRDRGVRCKNAMRHAYNSVKVKFR